MHFEQIYTGCLAHAAYYLESDGEAAIFDPLREVDAYIEKAYKDFSRIKYIFETHFHADFVSGHLELMNKTKAKIVFGPTANPSYEAIIANDNEVFKVGHVSVKVLHTPGHTMESTSYLIIDEHGNDHALITGDTLLMGDVGRPDLVQNINPDLSQEKLAGYLFDSLRHKIMPLNDNLVIYPNHGAGSACGKMMSKEIFDTLGHQKKVNYALNPALTKDEFIKLILRDLAPAPQYFPENVLMNIKGYEGMDQVLKRAESPLTPQEFEILAKETNALILDTRSAADFAKGFIPNSINIGIDGNFAQWVGELISPVQRILLLVTEPGREKESILRLSRVGYDNTIGYLKDGFTAWKNAGKKSETIFRLSIETFKNKYFNEKPFVFDVRKKSEFDSERLLGAVNIPLNQLTKHLESFPKERPFVLYCAGGYRSIIAASILRQHGFHNFSDVIGGFAEIKLSDLLMTEYHEPVSML